MADMEEISYLVKLRARAKPRHRSQEDIFIYLHISKVAIYTNKSQLVLEGVSLQRDITTQDIVVGRWVLMYCQNTYAVATNDLEHV